MGASSLWTKEREAVPCLQNRLQSCVHQGTLFTQFCSSIAGALVFPFNAPQLSRVMYAGRIHTVCDSDSSCVRSQRRKSLRHTQLTYCFSPKCLDLD